MQKHDPKVAFKVLNFFLRGKPRGSIVPEHQAMSPEDIKIIFRRAFIRLRAIYLLNKLSQEIVMYGTSSNLFDLSTRDRPALQRYLFPLNKSQVNRNQEIDFPLIHPDSYFKLVWNCIFSLIMAYTAIILPFRSIIFHKLVSFYVSSEASYWAIVDTVIDVLFWIDLLVSMCSAYYDEEGKLVKSRKIVIVKYIKGWFLLDLFSCLPISYIINEQHNGQVVKLVKLAKLPRLYKILKLSRSMRMTRFLSTFQGMDFFKFNYGMTRLFTLFLSVLLVTHLTSCLWHYVAAFNDYQVNSWVYQNGLIDQSVQTKYVASMYYSFSTLTTVGYGDIHAYSPQEKIITIILVILGVLFYSVVIGLLSSVLSQIDYKVHILNKKKAIMSEFCLEKKISRQLRDCLKETLEYNFSKNGFVWANDTKIFQDIPMNLRYEIMMSIHNGVFGQQSLFQLVDDKAFVVRVVPLLKPLFMLENEIIWEEKSNPDAIYLLDYGRVNFKTDFIVQAASNQSKQFSFKSMIGGSYFGDIEIFQHITRLHVAQCESKCEMYYLTLQAFENEIYEDFPHIMEKMRKIAEDRKKKNEETIEQLQQFIKEETTKPEDQVPPTRSIIIHNLESDKRKKTMLLRDYKRDSVKISKHEAALMELRKKEQEQSEHKAKTMCFPKKTVVKQIHHQYSKIKELVTIASEISALLDDK